MYSEADHDFINSKFISSFKKKKNFEQAQQTYFKSMDL